MCIIIANKKGRLTRKVLKQCWDRNSHGAGFAYASRGQIKVVKHLNSFTQFWKDYRAAYDKYGKRSEFLLHFRISTGGGKTVDNIHPFPVGGEMVMAHNGTLRMFTPTKTKSDTNIFCEELTRAGYGSKQLKAKITQRILKDFIGMGNKLVFLHKNGELTIVNEKANRAEWAKGNWYSNDSYRTRNMYAGDRLIGGTPKSSGNAGKQKASSQKKTTQKAVGTGGSIGTKSAAISSSSSKNGKRTTRISSNSRLFQSGAIEHKLHEELKARNPQTWGEAWAFHRFALYDTSKHLWLTVDPRKMEQNSNRLIYDNVKRRMVTVTDALLTIDEVTTEAARMQALADFSRETGASTFSCMANGCDEQLTHDEVEHGDGYCLNCYIAINN